MSRGQRGLSPGDHVFLSFLTLGPMSPYDVKAFMAQSVSNFWTAAHSQVYQQASRLVRDGFVRERQVPGGRRRRLLSLTPKGRRAVLGWLRRPARPPQVFSELLVKLFFAPQAGDPAATRRMLEEDRRRVAEHLAGFEELRKALEPQPEMRYPLMTLDMGIRFHRTLLDWLDETLRRVP